MQLIDLLKETYGNWKEHHTIILGAALTYYAVFSLVPFLVILVALASIFLSHNFVTGQITQQLSGVVGSSSAHFIELIVQRSNEVRPNIALGLFGLLVILWGATSVFSTLKQAMHIIWHTNISSRGGFIELVLTRIRLFLILFMTVVLAMIFLASSAFLTYFTHFINNALAISPIYLQLLNSFLSLIMLGLLISIIFKTFASKLMSWRDVLIGGLFTSVFLVAGNYFLGFYLGLGAISSVYGVAGSFVSILIWLYYSAQIFLFGAEITHTFAKKYSSLKD